MKKVFAVFTVLLCLMLCVAPALAYEYLLEASTKATPIMYQNLLSEDEENSRYYFYVGVDGKRWEYVIEDVMTESEENFECM